MDQRPRDLPDPLGHVRRHADPGPGRGLSLGALARAGATLVGRPVTVEGERVTLDESVAANLAAGDAFAARVRAMVDQSIRRRGLDAPPTQPDDHDAPVHLDPPVSLDLRAEEITSVVWCTGFAGDAATVADAVRDHLGPTSRWSQDRPAPGVLTVRACRDGVSIR